MLDLILKLIDRAIQLLNARQAGRAAHFDDVVAPLFADFEALHKDYLRCFDDYRSQLSAAETFSSEDPILARIYKDHIFSQDLRSKIEATFAMFPESPYAHKWDPDSKKHIPPSSEARERDAIEEFLFAISCYITGANRVIFEDDHFIYSNAPRSSLVTGLKFIFAMSGDEIRDFVERIDDSPCVFILNPTSGDLNDHYLFGCFFSSKGSWGRGDKPTGIWKDLQNRVAGAGSNTTEIQKAIGITLIDTIVHEMQYDYRRVTNAYTTLRKQARP